jgi:hypothetical protein
LDPSTRVGGHEDGGEEARGAPLRRLVGHEGHQHGIEGGRHARQLGVAELDDVLAVPDAIARQVRRARRGVSPERAEEARDEAGEPAHVVFRRGVGEVRRPERRGARTEGEPALDGASGTALPRRARPRIVGDGDDPALPECVQVPVERRGRDVGQALEQLRRGHRGSRPKGHDQAHPDRMKDQVGAVAAC